MSDSGRPPQEAGTGHARPRADDEVVEARARMAGGGLRQQSRWMGPGLRGD